MEEEARNHTDAGTSQADASPGDLLDGDLWLSDDEMLEKESDASCDWTSDMATCRAAHNSLENNLKEIYEKSGVSEDDVVAVYSIGAHLWGCATDSSSYKLLIVKRSEASKRGAKDKRQICSDANAEDREHRRFFLERKEKKGSKRLGREFKVVVESLMVFQKRLGQHQGLIPVWLPAQHVWMEAADVTVIRDGFQVDNVLLEKLVSAQCETTWKRIDKFIRKEDITNVRRAFSKLFRILLLGLQIARHGRIMEYTCQPELGRLLDSFSGPEIMALCDRRTDRVPLESAVAADGAPADVESVATEERSDRNTFSKLWTGLVSPLLEQLTSACAQRIENFICTEGNERGLARAMPISSVDILCSRFSPKEVLAKCEELCRRYQSKQDAMLAERSSLESEKLPQLRRAIDILKESQQNGVSMHGSETDNRASLLLGAQCLLEFTAEEALEMLEARVESLTAKLTLLDADCVFLMEQFQVTEANITKVKKYVAPRVPRKKCVIDLLLNVDDVKKHSAERSIPDYYLDLINYLTVERCDARAYSVWMEKSHEAGLNFSSHTSLFYKHMGSCSFFEKNKNFEKNKFRRNQALSAMTAPYTKKDGLTRILREYRGEKNGAHPADAARPNRCGEASADWTPRQGERVRMCGLEKKVDDNGLQGVLLEWMEDKSRWRLMLDSGKVATVRTENLEASAQIMQEGRVSATAADNIAPRSFNVGSVDGVESAYDDISAFEEDYIRGLAVAVCRRTMELYESVSNTSDDMVVAAPFELDLVIAAATVLRFANSHHPKCLYKLRAHEQTGKNVSEDFASYTVSQKMLFQAFCDSPLKEFNAAESWRAKVQLGKLKEEELPAILDCMKAWDPQMKTLYGIDNLWILKPKGKGRGKGIFVAECVRDITRTSGLRHLFSSFSSAGVSHLNESQTGKDAAEHGTTSGGYVDQESAMRDVERLGGYGLTRAESGWVGQKYIEYPLLYEGRKKFDIRFMAMVSFVGNDQLEAAPGAPGPGAVDLPWGHAVSGGAHAGGRLTCYSFEDSIMKICAADYDAEGMDNDEMRHLTNHAVQEHHPLYDPQLGVQDARAACARGCLGESPTGCMYHDILLPQMRALAYRVFQATPWERDWALDEGFYPTDVRYQLFGFDMMVDENLRVWVLEVNQQPGLSAEGVPAMAQIMHRLLRGMFGVLLDVERYDLICNTSEEGELPVEKQSPGEWPESAAGWTPLASDGLYSNCFKID